MPPVCEWSDFETISRPLGDGGSSSREGEDRFFDVVPSCLREGRLPASFDESVLFRTAIERAFDDAACAVNGRVSAVRTRRYSACDAMPRPQKALSTQYVISRSPSMEKAPAVPTSRSSRTIPKLEQSGENRSFARCASNATRSSGSAAVNAAIRTASGSRIIPKSTSRSVSSTGRSFTIFISQTIRRAADASHYRRARKPDGQRGRAEANPPPRPSLPMLRHFERSVRSRRYCTGDANDRSSSFLD